MAGIHLRTDTLTGLALAVALAACASDDIGGVMQYSQLVTQGLVQGQTTVRGTPPYTVRVRFAQFSGVFALGVAAMAPATPTRATTGTIR